MIVSDNSYEVSLDVKSLLSQILREEKQWKYHLIIFLERQKPQK